MPAKRRFLQETPDSPSDNYEVVTPSDSTDLPFVTRWIAVDDSDVAVVRPDGTEVTLPALGGPFLWNVRAARIKETGTSSGAKIVAIY